MWQKWPVHLLCTIVNTSSDDNWHLGEMKLISSIDDSFKPSAVNEVTHDIDSDHVDAQWAQPDSSPSNQCKIHRNSWPVPKIVMPSNVQIHRQVVLNDAKVLKEMKMALYNLLQKYNILISKSDNDIVQTDFIHQNAHSYNTRCSSNYSPTIPFGSQTPQHFKKKEIKILLDAGNICKSMSPWASLMVVVKKHTWRCATAVLLVHRP